MNKNFSKAEKSLIESDSKLGKVIENNGHLKFSIKKIDPFNELVKVIKQLINKITVPTYVNFLYPYLST